MGNGVPGCSGDGGPATLASLNSPSSVEKDARGNVYVSDSENHVVRIVNPAGTIRTLAGRGVAGYGGDGGSSGLWMLTRGIWQQLTEADPDFGMVADLDGDGRSEVFFSFKGHGLFENRASPGSWVRLTDALPSLGYTARRGLRDEAHWYFPGYGLYRYDYARRAWDQSW